MRSRNAALLLLATATFSAHADEGVYRGHGLAMHGDLKYPAGFEHFDYVNPDAPKGGNVTTSGIGGFDSFNMFIIKGNPAQGMGRIYDTLMVSSADEPFSMYCLVCETIEVPKDRSWVAFHIDPKARWHDGKPITADDVIWSFNTLFEKGAPFYRFYYGSVAKVEKVGDNGVKFNFKPGENRELPLILGQLPVLPKHYWEGLDFAATTLEPPLGSGAYKIKEFETNRSVVYERFEDYWAKDHPTQRGFDNFDLVREEYYRDRTVAREAFKAGAVDYWLENSAKEWATAFDIPAQKRGDLVTKAIPNHNTQGMQGFVMNMRRTLFQDPRVRRALNYAFDFEWSNKTLFYDQYTRTDSYFDNSELASSGLPKGAELAILEKYRDKLPKEVFDTEYTNPVTDGSGNNRENLRVANKLLRDAGWRVDRSTRKLTHTETGQVFSFEVLLVSPAFERIVLPFKQNLARLGIDVSVRTVDTAQYQKRVQDFDFDMAVGSWGQSESPGNEQRDFWGSDASERPGSRNLAGLKDPVVDELVETLIAARDREALVTATRALDRVLLWKFLVVPHFHIEKDRIAYWNKFGMPSVVPDRGVQFSVWWIDPQSDGAAKNAKPADGK
ncbi:MAG: extracellular solute-binding protein [Gammaproteobacteria bacterium]|jgi:microcin C transport system substrate-binding protein